MLRRYFIIGLVLVLACQLAPVLSASRSSGEEGQASRIPWSGWWWPLLDTKNPNLYDDGGPLEKYDSYVETLGWGNPDTQGWEYENHSTTDPEASWWGHCHAWAAAAVLEPEPLAAGYDAGIYFTVADLKGLVTEAYYAPSSTDNFGERYNGRAEDDLQDIYPGLFHTILRYYLRDRHKAMVADIDEEEEVWNYPMYRYTMEFTPDSQYSDVTHVLARVWYADDGVVADYAGTQALIKDYTYWIQMSGNEIIDSGWEGDSADDHPDFVWVPDGRDEESTPVDMDVVKDILISYAQQGCSEYLPNGDLETGEFAPWVALGETQLEELDTVNAWLGGYDDAEDILYQTLAIPSQATTASLSFYWLMSTEETEHAYDLLKVTVRDGSGTVLQTLQTIDDGQAADTWQTSSHDLRAYKGRTIQIHFEATTDDSSPTSFYVDDVSLNVCTGAVPTPTSPPGPGATPTIPPAANGCREAIENGGFETGDFDSWDVGDPWTSSGYQAEVTDEAAHSGGYSAWLGGYEDADDLIVQSLVIPAQASRALLSYFWLMDTEEEEDHGYDFLYVRLLDGDGDELATLQTADDGDSANQWQSAVFDLKRYAGQEVQLEFEVTGDEDNITSFFIDDVRLEICGGPTPTPRSRVFLPVVLKRARR